MQEGAITLTPEERDQIEKILPKVIDIIKGPQIPSSEYKKVDWIYYKFADKTSGQVYVYVGNDSPKSGAYFQTNDPKNPNDNIIVVQQNSYAKFFNTGNKIRKFLTGEENQGIEDLRKTLKHQLIHAKDPGLNQHKLKEPYDSEKEEIYYKSWTEFQPMTGQFFDAIISKVDDRIKNDTSDENIRIIEFVLKNILDFFAGKEKNLYQPTVDFIQDTKSRNFFQRMFQKLEYDLHRMGIKKYPGNVLNTYVYYINKIKKYHPEAYNEFLKDLYKVIDQAKDKINNALEIKRKDRDDRIMKNLGKNYGKDYLQKSPSKSYYPRDVKLREMQYIDEAKRMQELAGINEVEQNQVNDAEIDAAMKAGLAALTNEGKKLEEIEDNNQPQELNESVVALIASGMLAAPKIIEWVGKAIGFITNPFKKDNKDENTIAKKVEHFAHKWEKVYIKAIMWVVKKTKFVKQIWMDSNGKVDDQKLLVVAKYLYAAILAIALGNAVGTILGPASPIMKAIEGSLGGVKAIEIAQIASKVKGQL